MKMTILTLLLASSAAAAPVHLSPTPWLATSAVTTSGQFTFEFDPGPVAIYKADGYRQWDHTVPLPAGRICEVRTFIGWDRGSLGEANFELNLGNYRLYERSEHKESPANYDAWKARTGGVVVTAGTPLNLHLGAVQTGPNVHDGGLSTRVHFSVRLRMAQADCDAE